MNKKVFTVILIFALVIATVLGIMVVIGIDRGLKEYWETEISVEGIEKVKERVIEYPELDSLIRAKLSDKKITKAEYVEIFEAFQELKLADSKNQLSERVNQARE